MREDLSIAQAQLRDYQTRLGASFAHVAYLSELTALRDKLKFALSGTPPEAAAEPSPSVPELAEQIKALKAAHSIDATPERTGRRRSSAEEPVTARIRRRTGDQSVFDPMTPTEATDTEEHGQPEPPVTFADDSAGPSRTARKPGNSYQERVVRVRESTDFLVE